MTLQSNVFVSFQKITFKPGSFTDFKAFFPAMLIVYRSLVLVKILKTTMEGSIKAISVHDLKMKTHERYRNNKRMEIEQIDWFIEQIQMWVAFGWLREHSAEKTFMPENLLEINQYFALMSYCNMIGQSNNAFSILGFSLVGKRRGHVLIFSSIGC